LDCSNISHPKLCQQNANCTIDKTKDVCIACPLNHVSDPINGIGTNYTCVLKDGETEDKPVGETEDKPVGETEEGKAEEKPVGETEDKPEEEKAEEKKDEGSTDEKAEEKKDEGSTDEKAEEKKTDQKAVYTYLVMLLRQYLKPMD